MGVGAQGHFQTISSREAVRLEFRINTCVRNLQVFKLEHRTQLARKDLVHLLRSQLLTRASECVKIVTNKQEQDANTREHTQPISHSRKEP